MKRDERKTRERQLNAAVTSMFVEFGSAVNDASPRIANSTLRRRAKCAATRLLKILPLSMLIHRALRRDVIQETEGELKVPEIRVWIHSKGEDDRYQIFQTLAEADEFVRENALDKTVEDLPLIAYRGYEMTYDAFRLAFPKTRLNPKDKKMRRGGKT